MNELRWSLVSAASALCAVLAAPATAAMELNTNRYGSDYRGFDAASPQQCEAACAKEAAQCRAWTWVRPGVQGPGGRCWLKNQVPAKSANSCCVSGVARPPSTAQVRQQPPAGKGNTTTAQLAPGAAQLVRVTPSTNAQEVLRMPDATALEDAQGRRATVGGVRAELAVREKIKTELRLGSVKAVRLKNPRPNPGFHSVRGGPAGLSGYLAGERAIASGAYREALADRGKQTALVKPGSIPLDPAIISVNKKHPTKFTFTPGVELAIRGRGFGKSGQVRLAGNFSGPVKFAVNHWQDDLIYATMDPFISGELDKDDVMLEVVPAGRRPIQASGAHFYAARRVVPLAVIPQRYATLPGQSASYCLGGSLSAAVRCAAEHLRGVRRQSDTEWFQPGSDYYRFDALKPGFTTDSFDFAHGRTDGSGNVGCSTHGGSMGFKGQYAASWDGDNIRVDWGVWHCHSSPYVELLPPFPREGWDFNESFYALTVYVAGPRGVEPWK